MWPPIARVGPLPPSTRAATFGRPSYPYASYEEVSKYPSWSARLSADGSPDIWLKVHCLKSIDYHLLCAGRLVAGHSFRGHEIAEQVEEV